MKNTITLYHTENASWIDPWGGKHPAQKIVEEIEVHISGTWAYTCPYTGKTSLEPVAVLNGETYHSHPPIDYYGGTRYVRQSDGAHFTRHRPYRLIDDRNNAIL